MINTGCSKVEELSSSVLLLVVMPFSVSLSYECAIYFFMCILLGVVKEAKWQSFAIT